MSTVRGRRASPARSCSAAPPDRRRPHSPRRRVARRLRSRGRSATRAAGSRATSRSSSGRTSSPRTTRGSDAGRGAWGEQNDVEVESTSSPTRASPRSRPPRRRRNAGTTSSASSRRLRGTRTRARPRRRRPPRSRRRSGRYGELGKRSTYNPKTKTVLRRLGLATCPARRIWRHDLWNAHRRVAGDAGITCARLRAALKAARPPHRDRAGGRARLERRADRAPDVLRLVPAGRVRRPRDRQRADGGGGAVHGRSLEAARWREHASSTGTPPRTTSSSSRARGRWS